jgi:adenine-specific DNA-methyltransferase
MAQTEIKQGIKTSIKAFQNGNLTENAISFFKALSYNIERQQPFEEKSYSCFKELYLNSDTRFNKDKALVSHWNYIDLLFQLSRDEINLQHGSFDTKQVDQTIIETYLFFTIELREESYVRSALSQITREINKVFPMPVMVLFKHGKTLTLSVINRRLHKLDVQKDVLEKVTLIKDVSTDKPHRAHIETLYDLSFDELFRIHKFSNFVELHNAWQKTLDINELNKRFYKELSNWYFWAMRNVYFPGASHDADNKGLFQKDEKVREHNAKNLIRLLTRILFVWFTKEKNLIPDELFDEIFVEDNLLKNFEPRRKNVPGPQSYESRYYRAILQNLFFATLNQAVGKREFRKSGQHTNVTNLMRYESYFKDKDAFLALVEKTVPFMNGGLFECLDKPSHGLKGKKGGDVIAYEDGFSDRPDNELCVPDYIFFGTSEHADLSEDLGSKSKNVEVKGLLNIFKSYKFTIIENTPIEEDIALDPELLGKVFENLLASYNHETKTTARKQTGSFYTPREIVNYMVDQSLFAYLKQKMDDAGIRDKETDLLSIISYSESPNPFNTKETAVLIAALDTCKILDPACGSGAFPMGILHKLVYILDKLDPENELWKEKQIQKVAVIDDDVIRNQQIDDIETTFNNNELDYGRKLYLIENCIYGVDIQPIASQISKLRCFISLIVDQRVDNAKDNFGIIPLPNLETKFVAANTLIGIEKPKAQLYLINTEVNKLEKQIKDVRHRLFRAKTPATKRKLREDDNALRKKLGEKLVDSGLGSVTAHQLASWDPYDQNATSTFFDPEWMFGISDGFDVVIGNPPYIKEYTDKSVFDGLRNSECYQGKMDIWYLFGSKGIDMLKMNGVLSYIATNHWIANAGASLFRNKVLTNTEIRRFIDFGDYKIFENAGIQTMIFLLLKIEAKGSYNCLYTKIINKNLEEQELSSLLNGNDSEKWESFVSTTNKALMLNKPITFINHIGEFVLEKIECMQNFILNDKEVAQGIVGAPDKAFIINKSDICNYLPKERQYLKLFHTNAKRYYTSKPEKYIFYLSEKNFKESLSNFPNMKNHFDNFKLELKQAKVKYKTPNKKYYYLHRERDERFFKEGGKIICASRTAFPSCTYTDKPFYGSRALNFIKTDRINLKYLTSILNSKISHFWLKNKGKLTGDLLQVDKSQLLSIPIFVCSSTLPFEIIIDCILFANENSIEVWAITFETVINALVFELYFTDHMKERKLDVLGFIEKDIEEVMQGKKFETLSDFQKDQAIAELHKRWSDQNSEIVKRMNSFAEKSPEILKPIMES